jgi:MFS family permease
MKTSRLFAARCVALIVTATRFAIRGGAAGAWATEFHRSNEQLGWINSAAFWGFTLAIIFGGPLGDTLGLGKMVGLAFAGRVAGIVLSVFAWDFLSLFGDTLLSGIANGSAEAACNPLVATIFSSNKTTMLNRFHFWFPGRIVIGGLTSYALDKAGLGWKVQFASMLVPLAIYAFMFFKQEFPKTERAEQGVSTGDMFAACVSRAFLLMVVCMLMTVATALGPQQWIPNILSKAGVSVILVLVWITGLMAVGRQFAGPFVRQRSPIGMLVMRAVLSTLGL